jgi:hypothetical protein
MRIKSLLIGVMILVGISVKASDKISMAETMFIYNFLRHIEWPQGSTGEKFVIGVYGNASINGQLKEYTANRKVGSRSIVVKTVSSPGDAATCQVVFVPANEASRIAQLKSSLGNSPTLIIGEKEGSNAHGATIEFVLQGTKLNFRIDESKARSQNLSISRALLDMSI